MTDVMAGMSRARTTMFRRIPLVAVLAVTAAFTLGPDVVGPSNVWDFFAHASAYAALTVSAIIWPGRSGASVGRDIARTVLVVAFGAAMELAQRLVGRDAQIGDVGANAIGAGVGFILMLAARAYLSARRERRGVDR
jgi:VanZ family protein